MNHSQIIRDFIEKIWNQNNFTVLDHYLHQEFRDHSLPTSFTPNNEGLRLWVEALGQSFQHQTIIEQLVYDEDLVIVKIKMLLTHIGIWRGVEATGFQIQAIGYRSFRLLEGKIMEHWALIDGNAIENQLKEAHKGCKIQV